MQGVKHIVECRCILTQFKNRSDPVFHKFVVFSVLDKDQVQPNYAQCNNCGIVHKIIDLCKSEIISGKEELKSLETIEDIRFSLPDDLCEVLDSYSCELPNWQHVRFIYTTQQWDSHIILVKEEIDQVTQGKILRILGHNKFKIETFIDDFSPRV